MPYGGSVTLEMVPLFVVSLAWGSNRVWSGFVVGILNLFLDPCNSPDTVGNGLSPSLCSAGACRYVSKPADDRLGIGYSGRYMSMYCQGPFFGAWPEGMNPDHSLGYNASYIIPNGI